MISEKFDDNSFILYDYDQSDRLVRKTAISSNGREESVVTYTYNEFDEMLSAEKVVSEQRGNQRLVTSYAWTYDILGQVISESAAYEDESAVVTTYAYDSEGRLVEVVYPEESNLGTVSYDYDYFGNLQSIKTGDSIVAKYGYDSMYRLHTAKQYLTPGGSNYILKTNTYGKYDRLDSIIYTKNGSANAVVESYVYQYDDAGNITSRVRGNGTPSGIENRTYTYDEFYDELIASSTTENGATVNTSYSYDAVGNRISMTEGSKTTNYTYNGLNQLIEKNDSEEKTSYIYDARGNQIQEKSTDSTMNFEYLVTGELAEVRNENGDVLQENEYNHEGIRICREEGAESRRYFYDQGNVAFTEDNGDISTANVRSLDGEMIGSYRENSYYLYTEDIQGSTGVITDCNANVKNTYDYSDFGEVTLSGANTIENEICYAGAVYDASMGLHYLNARYYDPENGRFISQDSFRGNMDDFGQWHLYAYCANNPITYVDPSGEKRKTSSSSLPKTGSKIWFCLETSKKALKDNLMPYFKRDTFKEEFKLWFLDQATGGLYSLYCNFKDKNTRTLLESIIPDDCTIRTTVTELTDVTGCKIMTYMEAAIGLQKAFYNSTMHKIYEKIKAFYDKDLKGNKNSYKVFFCTEMKYQRKGSKGTYLPTTNVCLFKKKIASSQGIIIYAPCYFLNKVNLDPKLNSPIYKY